MDRKNRREKLVILTDVHANLPALEAVLAFVTCAGYDQLIHLGDAVGIGPFPAECLARLLNLENARFVMGNHDAWLAHGLPQPQPAWMSDEEVAHQQWTHRQVNQADQQRVAQWPYVRQESWSGVSVTTLHYTLDSMGSAFAPIVPNPSAADLHALFEKYRTELVLYGHTHQRVDIGGNTHYINPGALGCNHEPLARFTIIECEDGQYEVRHQAVEYDPKQLYDAYEERQVPARETLYRIFFGDLLPC